MNTKQFGERVAELREKCGMTQSQLADQLNVSNKTISRWETGDGYPEITLLVPLAKSLGVTVDYLLSESADREDSQFEHNSNRTNRKEYRHREIPVIWPKKQLNKVHVTAEKEKKRPVIQNAIFRNNLLHCIFYILITCIFCSANHYSLYTSGDSDSVGMQGYFTGKTFGLILITFVLAGILLLIVSDLRMVRSNPEKKNEGIVHIGISMFYLFGICLGVKPVSGTWIKESYIMKSYAEGSLLQGFDWFQYNRRLLRTVGCLTIGLYIVFHLILVIRKWKIERASIPEKKCYRLENIKIFWSSLILFNKIGVAAIIISGSGLLISYGIYAGSFLLQTIGSGFDIPMYYLMILVIIMNISTTAAKAGFISAVIGLGAGLLDCFDRQYKASIIIAVINIIFIYLFPMILALLQIANIIEIGSSTLESVIQIP